jgi:hypothetical protein
MIIIIIIIIIIDFNLYDFYLSYNMYLIYFQERGQTHLKHWKKNMI